MSYRSVRRKEEKDQKMKEVLVVETNYSNVFPEW